MLCIDGVFPSCRLSGWVSSTRRSDLLFSYFHTSAYLAPYPRQLKKSSHWTSSQGARRSLAQPAVKCRGPEYLRIIHGSEYTLPNNPDRLRFRGLSVKRSRALREFALGVEALGASYAARVHECLFAVLALQSASVDPRL
jgi:hypothetical protein